jgi:hypothetical protein
MVRSAAKPRVSNHGRLALLGVARPSRAGFAGRLRTRVISLSVSIPPDGIML